MSSRTTIETKKKIATNIRLLQGLVYDRKWLKQGFSIYSTSFEINFWRRNCSFSMYFKSNVCATIS